MGASLLALAKSIYYLNDAKSVQIKLFYHKKVLLKND